MPTLPLTQGVIRVPSLGVKWPPCQTDHSPPHADVKDECSYACFHPCALMACGETTLSLLAGVKEQDNGALEIRQRASVSSTN